MEALRKEALGEGEELKLSEPHGQPPGSCRILSTILARSLHLLEEPCGRESIHRGVVQSDLH